MGGMWRLHTRAECRGYEQGRVERIEERECVLIETVERERVEDRG